MLLRKPPRTKSKLNEKKKKKLVLIHFISFEIPQPPNQSEVSGGHVLPDEKWRVFVTVTIKGGEREKLGRNTPHTTINWGRGENTFEEKFRYFLEKRNDWSKFFFSSELD